MNSGPSQNCTGGRALNPTPNLIFLVRIHLQGQKHLWTEGPGQDSSWKYSSRHANEDGWLHWKISTWGFFKALNGEWDLIFFFSKEEKKQSRSWYSPSQGADSGLLTQSAVDGKPQGSCQPAGSLTGSPEEIPGFTGIPSLQSLYPL